MNNFSKVYNGRDIYSYPFKEEIEFFFVLGSTNIYTLSKEDFDAFKKYFVFKNIEVLTIVSGESKDEFFIKDLIYENYFEKYFLNVKDHFIFWGEDAGIAISEESFGLVGGNIDFLKFIVQGIGKEELTERFTDFIIEWNARKANTWASKLVNRVNHIDLFEIGI